MTSPPIQALLPAGLEKEDWQRIMQRGVFTDTWKSKGHILQRRPIASLEHWKTGQNVLAPLMDSPLFIGAKSEVVVIDNDFFWTLQNKLEGITVVPEPGEKWHSSWSLCQKMVADLSIALSALAELPLFLIDNLRKTAILRSFSLPAETVVKEAREIFTSAGWLHRMPEEPKTPLVVAHGDPASKNIILGNRAFLIDWEMVSVLPRSADPTHFTAYCLKHAPPKEWEKIVEVCGKKGLARAAGLDDEDWKKAALWGALRDFIAFPDRKEDQLRWSEGLSRFVNNV